MNDGPMDILRAVIIFAPQQQSAWLLKLAERNSHRVQPQPPGLPPASVFCSFSFIDWKSSCIAVIASAFPSNTTVLLQQFAILAIL